MRSRGQSAAQFVASNLGVLILIVLLAMLLLYLGSLNSAVSAKSCRFPGLFSCSSFSYGELGGLDVEVGHASGSSIVVYAVSCTSREYPDFQPLASPVLIPHGTNKLVSGEGSGNRVYCNHVQPVSGSTYSGKLCIAYTDINAQVNRTLCGDIIVPVT